MWKKKYPQKQRMDQRVKKSICKQFPIILMSICFWIFLNDTNYLNIPCKFEKVFNKTLILIYTHLSVSKNKNNIYYLQHISLSIIIILLRIITYYLCTIIIIIASLYHYFWIVYFIT